VEDPVIQERLTRYQNRVADWMGEQGILFQIRHAGTIGSSNIGRKLGSMAFSMIIMVLVLMTVGYFGITHHFKSAGHRNKLLTQLQDALNAEECEGGGCEREPSSILFKDVSLTGSDSSFFTTGEMTLFSSPAGFLTGITDDWVTDSVQIKKVDFELKAGGDESMNQAFDLLVSTMDGSSLSKVEINQASFDWGYSVLTYGRVEDSKLSARVSGGQWEISLSGGTFKQNWLDGFGIKSGKLIVSSSGIQIEELVLSKAGGFLNLKGTIAGTPVVPRFALTGDFEGLPVDELLSLPGIKVRDYMSGTISGDIEIEGSPDRVITTKGRVKLGAKDIFVLREKWHILSALSVLDKHRTYRRLNFTEGGFDFETGKGALTLSNIDILAREEDAKHVARLVGQLETRLPTQEEAAEAIGMTLTKGFNSGFSVDATDSSAAQALEDERISLKKAAGGGKKNDFGDFFDAKRRDSDTRLIPEEIEGQRLRAQMNVHRINGNLDVVVSGDAFSQYPVLEEVYKLGDNGLRTISMAIDGTVLTATKPHATKLYDKTKVVSAKSAEVAGE